MAGRHQLLSSPMTAQPPSAARQPEFPKCHPPHPVLRTYTDLGTSPPCARCRCYITMSDSTDTATANANALTAFRDFAAGEH